MLKLGAYLKEVLLTNNWRRFSWTIIKYCKSNYYSMLECYNKWNLKQIDDINRRKYPLKLLNGLQA